MSWERQTVNALGWIVGIMSLVVAGIYMSTVWAALGVSYFLYSRAQLKIWRVQEWCQDEAAKCVDENYNYRDQWDESREWALLHVANKLKGLL